MVLRGLHRYVGKTRLFSANARLYLANLALGGLVFGVYALLFNFYVLAQGHDEALLGRLLSLNSSVSLLAAIPNGVLSDRIGRKWALLLAGFGTAAAIAGMVIWPTAGGLLAMSVLLGLSQSLAAVSLGPFLMENSGEAERAYLYSASFGLQMVIGVAGFWLAGRLPGWLATLTGAPAGEANYTAAMVLVAVGAVVALLPLLFLRPPRGPAPQRDDWRAPYRYARREPVLLGKLMAPIIITSLGAALFVPFMNIFFRDRFGMDDAAIGTLFAVASLAMGAGILGAAPLAERYGPIRMVVLTQALSIPFLILLGFAPLLWLSILAYLVRVVLMNMSLPVYEMFAMERVGAEARGTTASLLNMSWSLGWAVSPLISGWLQVNFGFDVVFGAVVSAYLTAIALYWRFFGLRVAVAPAA